jgi:enoyl-[acyl-carrier protein] reductase II
VLGADGVWVGTRFIATPEARSAPGYKDALLRTTEDGTTVTRSYSGKPMRTVRNAWTEYHDEHPEDIRRFPEQLGVAVEAGALHLGADDTATGVDPDRECYPAGQGVGGIDELVPAGEVVRRFVSEAEAALRAVDAGRSR